MFYELFPLLNYYLKYGSNWFSNNSNAILLVIEFGVKAMFATQDVAMESHLA